MPKRIVPVPQSQFSFPFDPVSRAEEIRRVLFEQLDTAVVAAVSKMMTDEVLTLSGKHFARKGGERLHRGGSAPGSIYLRGQRLAVRRPRVNKNGKERDLQSYKAFEDYDVFSQDVARLLMHGVSTRDYSQAIDQIADGVPLGRSAVSDAFKYATQKHLDELNGRRLEKQNFVVLFMDGIEFAGMAVVVALGITQNGEKVILGLREGASENGQVCTDLIGSLLERGLLFDGKILVVIDGSKALKKAVQSTWGDRAVIARCRVHKTRNVLEYLSKSYHAEARRRLNAAWNMNEYEAAKTELLKVVRWLTSINESAASSLEEAFEETLTLHRLGLPEILRKSLSSTNVIESAFSIVRARTSRVKNWRKGRGQILRWSATGLAFAEKRMKKIRGHKYLALLVEKLGRKVDLVCEVA